MASIVQTGDLGDRVSYVSAASKKDGEYLESKTPNVDIEGGALRAGGRPMLWTKDYIGLMVQYMAVGIVYGALPSTVYPLLQNYLNMEGTQIVSARVLLTLPWSFKVVYGFLTDCFPIFGYRRRPFIVIGWSMCAVMLLIMACSKIGKPYYINNDLRYLDPANYTEDDLANGINKDAPDAGGKFIVLMMLAAVGYVGADVACDAMVVELAQREPEEVRGTTQTTIYLVRTVFMIVANILTGFFFNGKQYGGDFDFSLSFPQLMIIVLIGMLPAIPMGWFFIKEEKHPGVNFKTYMLEFWELMQSRAMYQIVLYKFVSGIFGNMTQTASSPIMSYWAKVTPINDTISTVLGNAVFGAVLFCTGKWGLQWNWRWIVAVTAVLAAAVDSIGVLFTTWDVLRSQWFWLGPPIVEQVPYGVGWMVSSFVMVELAGQGNEGAVYGLLTTCTNLSQTVSSTIAKNIGSNFDVTSDDIKADTHHVRMEVTWVYLIAYGCQIFSLVFLPMLPSQKKQTQELIAKGGKSKLIGGFTCVLMFLALVYGVMVNIMSIFPSTKCLRFVGGSGC